MKYKEHTKDEKGRVIRESTPKIKRRSKSNLTRGAFGRVHGISLLVDYSLEMKRRKQRKERQGGYKPDISSRM